MERFALATGVYRWLCRPSPYTGSGDPRPTRGDPSYPIGNAASEKHHWRTLLTDRLRLDTPKSAGRTITVQGDELNLAALGQ